MPFSFVGIHIHITKGSVTVRIIKPHAANLAVFDINEVGNIFA